MQARLFQFGSDARANVAVTFAIAALPIFGMVGAAVDYTPYFQHPLSVGTHSVVLVAEDGRRKSFKVVVKAGEEARRLWLFDEERWGEL